MGSDNSPNDDSNIHKNYSIQGLGVIKKQNNYPQHLNTDPEQQPNDSEKLQPIRRHSNINNINNFSNHISSKNVTNFQTPMNSLPPQNKNSELPSLIERSKSRKLSQQYCADFKKSYLNEGNGNKSRFLNHLADSLNHGKAIPREEIEKFKQEYLPKYVFDWRFVDDPRTGLKYWKNLGKAYFDQNFEIKMKKLGTNPIGASEPFYIKRCWFYRYLMNNFARKKNENPLIYINRNNILEDSYNQFSKIQGLNISRPLKIRFINEQVVDEEGVYREWYQSLFKEILSPQKKLFVFNPHRCLEQNTLLFYPKYPGMRMELYEFIGKLVIKSIADIITIRNCVLNRVLLKSIVKRPVTLDDIKYYNLDLYQKLKFINDSKIKGNKQLESIRFIWNVRGLNNSVQEIELVQGGRNIFLNDDNKISFIDKVIYVEAIRPYEEQIKYSQKGLLPLLSKEIQGGVFSVEELNFLISGQENIDLNDWKENTVYKGCYNANHPIIKMFWEKLGSLQKYELLKFFEFSTGTGSVPIDGFGSLKGVGGRIAKFTIEPYTNYSSDNPDQYTFHRIEAKRIHNTIVLPEYRSKQEFDQAINFILYNK